MILSQAHKFVFIKGRKVAGTSIEIALASICGPDDIVTPVFPIEERERLRVGSACRNYAIDRMWEPGYLALLAETPPAQLLRLRPPPQRYYNHMPLKQVERRYPDRLDDFRIVCAERSPYAKMISWLNMEEGTFSSYRVGGTMLQALSDLSAAFDREHAAGRIAEAMNIPLYLNSAGVLRVEVLRYENLQDEFDAFVRTLGCQPPPLPHAKKGLMSDTLDPRAIFRRDQIDAINDVFAEEFEAFGYARI